MGLDREHQCTASFRLHLPKNITMPATVGTSYILPIRSTSHVVLWLALIPPRSELMRSRYVQSLMFGAQCFLSFPQVLSSLVHNATPRAIVTGCSPLDPRTQTAPLAS
jgi:hypothetical protein